MRRPAAVVVTILPIAFLLATSTTALGDGGTVQVRETHGTTQVTVFTSPTPLRVGMIDVSVLVQDQATGATVTDAEIEVVLSPVDAPPRTFRGIASSERVVNKLLRVAEFELVESGTMHCEVVVRRPQQPDVRVGFQVDIAPAPARWVRYWPWFTWPIIPIAWFALRRKVSRPPRTEMAPA